jgi:small subunit ribosomal protein S17
MPKRILEGVVVSDKGDKTVVVKVERTLLHPLLKKTVRRSKKYHAHDETNAYKTGDIARIIECAPKSKLKTWEVRRRRQFRRAPGHVHQGAGRRQAALRQRR